MKVLASAVLFALGLLAQEPSGPLQSPPAAPAKPAKTPEKSLAVPADTKINLALTAPVWSRSAKAGDSVYSVTAFPVAVDNQMAIPPGTYVQGIIDKISRPTWLSGHAEIQAHFTQMIFANGYAVALDGNSAPAPAGNAFDPATAVALIYVQVSARSDILLDNSTQIEMILQKPLQLDAVNVGAAARLAKPMQIGVTRSASRCVPIPATPGTEPTIIPGTPGTSGTPPTVIPGGPGQPPIVVPGTPPTAGTPPTVIGGSAGTPGVPCPGPPFVIRTAGANDQQTKPFEIAARAFIGGTHLDPGSYQIKWTGYGTTRADILKKGKLVASVPMRVLLLPQVAASNGTKTHANADGSVSVDALVFAAENLLLVFD